MMKKLLLLLSGLSVLLLCSCNSDWSLAKKIESQIYEPSFRECTYDITSFGASGDGVADAIPSMLSAIDKCSMEGGGTVLVPRGKYFCKGSVILKSNVNLHFEDGAELIFSTDPADYLPCVLTRWEGTEVFNYSPMIYAYGVSNVAITGNGILNGQGKAGFEAWKANQKPDQKELRRMGTEGVPVHERVFGEDHLLRPAMVEFMGCNTMLIQGVKIVDGTFWSFHLIGCTNAVVRGITVDCTNLNSDGVDPESSRNVIIEDCYFHTGDDGIAVKSGRDQDGWRIGQPTENVIIRRCTFNTDANGLCIGSEISGGVRNVFMEDCHIIHAKQGIYFKSNLDRGGYIEHVRVRNIKVDQVSSSLVKFEPDYKSESQHNYPTYMHDIVIEDVTAKKVGEYGVYGLGFEQMPIEDITIRNLKIDEAGDQMNIENVRNLSLENVSIAGERFNETISR